MATGVQVWSQTAATNATVDTNINWAEGMAPSAVNDSARAEMSSVAKWRDDNTGSLITSGSSTAFTLATNQVATALTSGYTVAFQFHATADSSATLAVDGLTAKPLQIFPGANLFGQEYQANSRGSFVYSSTGTGQWIANNPPVHNYLTNTTTADIGLSTSYTNGPFVVTTGMGIWYLSGEILLQNTSASGAVNFNFRLNDGGSNTYASGTISVPSLNNYAVAHLSAIVVNPTGSIFFQALGSATGCTMRVGDNVGDGSNASKLNAVRIG